MIKIVPVVIVSIVESVKKIPGWGTAGFPEIGAVIFSRKKLTP
jgi:hypothetical protein